jgi:hypothetical protein
VTLASDPIITSPPETIGQNQSQLQPQIMDSVTFGVPRSRHVMGDGLSIPWYLSIAVLPIFLDGLVVLAVHTKEYLSESEAPRQHVVPASLNVHLGRLCTECVAAYHIKPNVVHGF